MHDNNDIIENNVGNKGLSKVKEIKLSTLIEVESPPTSTPRGGEFEGKSTSADKSNQSLTSDNKGITISDNVNIICKRLLELRSERTRPET